jgi:hypothetical protein
LPSSSAAIALTDVVPMSIPIVVSVAMMRSFLGNPDDASGMFGAYAGV